LPEEMLAFIFISDELLLHKDSSLIRESLSEVASTSGLCVPNLLLFNEGNYSTLKITPQNNDPGKEASRISI